MIDIREALSSEIATIANFQVLMALETENLILDEKTVKTGVKKFFDKPEMGKYIMAEDGNELVGCLLMQYEWSDWRNSMVVWLHSVYVIPEYRKMGVFKLMYKYVENLVNSSPDYAGIRLFVDKSNEKAQHVYKKLGMTSEHYELFEWLK